ncbi:hypothetical protein ACFL2J_05595 [Candidatus Omnitrophota bacterium]
MADYTAANVLIGVGMLKVDGVSIGYTSGGVNLIMTADRMDKEVDQSYAPIGIHKIRESFEVRTNLAEATLENLKLIWEQTEAVVSGVGTRSLSWGMNPAVIEHTLEFHGYSPEGFDRSFSVHKAVVWEVGEMVHQKDALTVVPVTFRVLPDITQGDGKEYGAIVDTTT